MQSITLDDGTKIVANGAVVAGAPSVNLATTNFTANDGDSYPFTGLAAGRRGRALPAVAVRLHHADLGGAVTAAQYPAGGSGRITLNP